jgi:FtsP/CotA-like multicopper oxidase with cupredoxin domain
VVDGGGSASHIRWVSLESRTTCRPAILGDVLKLLSVLPILAAGIAAAGPAPSHFHDQSSIPRSRVVEVSLTASLARLTLLPGVTTELYAYNGTVPGPMLEFQEGDEVVVHFRNDLPVETTVHWHGLHLPFDADGSPFHPVAPGATYEYRFTIRPGAAGTYWYHPHPNHATGVQVARGLYGGIIVRAPDDPLPATLTERLLILSDNRFLPDGSLDLPERHSHQGNVDFENGREGDVLFVNGDVMPMLEIRPGEIQRWRIINASAGRYYRLALSGHEVVQVGTEGGLFERPVPLDEILLAVAERVELLVRGGEPGSTAVLQALPYNRYIPQTRPGDWNETRDLLSLRTTTGPPAAPVIIPATLRPIQALDTSLATTTRVMVFSQGFINGQLMDMDRVDVSSVIGATEIWQVENIVGMDHPFHLHGFQFQVLDRNGVPEPFPAWKDTVNVPKKSVVRFIVRYENYPGKWMFHCHILDHEDHGMMGILEVH